MVNMVDAAQARFSYTLFGQKVNEKIKIVVPEYLTFTTFTLPSCEIQTAFGFWRTGGNGP